MTAERIAAYVRTWGQPPQGMPDTHSLYYRDRRNGWFYLTPEGQRCLTAEQLEREQARLHVWAKNAASVALDHVTRWGVTP
jgi:hypothetical protein